jgi:hypothetical protein
MGLLQIRNLVDGRTLLIGTVDLPARINRERAQLRLGCHRHAALQADWQQLGADAFAFEVLDTLTPPEEQTAGYDATTELAVLEELWIERITAAGGHPGYSSAS